MGYEDARRHLDPVRDFFEKKRELRISDSFHGPEGTRAFIVNTTATFIGAYLRDDVLVVMFRFDDTGIDPMHIDHAYEAVRKRVKRIMGTTFPGLPTDNMAVHVMDTSGNIGDFEF